MYENHLKSAYSVENGGKVLAITDTSCYTLPEETAFLAAALPESGGSVEYLDALSGLGLTEPRKIFDKLIAIGVLREKKRRAWRDALGGLLSPKVRILPARLQQRIFGPAVYGPRAATAMRMLSFPAALGMLWGALYFMAPGMAVPSVPEGGGSPAIVILLVLASSLVHELGHSLAAAASGIGLRPIGFSVYLIYPVFYTNVSGIDKLKLGDKALIDCGGFIAQSILVLALLVFVSAAGSPSAAEAARWVTAIMLFNLNPLFKTDGYWLYKDLYSEMKHNRWMRYVHHVYLAVFTGFSVYFLWLLFGRLGGIWEEAKTLASSPAYFWSGGYKVVLGAYFIFVGLAGGAYRFKEGHQEWKDLKRPANAPEETFSHTARIGEHDRRKQ